MRPRKRCEILIMILNVFRIQSGSAVPTSCVKVATSLAGDVLSKIDPVQWDVWIREEQLSKRNQPWLMSQSFIGGIFLHR